MAFLAHPAVGHMLRDQRPPDLDSLQAPTRGKDRLVPAVFLPRKLLCCSAATTMSTGTRIQQQVGVSRLGMVHNNTHARTHVRTATVTPDHVGAALSVALYLSRDRRDLLADLPLTRLPHTVRPVSTCTAPPRLQTSIQDHRNIAE